jgi:hypothetical protein
MRRVPWLLIAGLLLPAGAAPAQVRPGAPGVRPRVEWGFPLRHRMLAVRRWQLQQDLLRRRALLRFEMRHGWGPAFRGPALRPFLRGHPGFPRPWLWRRRVVRI